MAILPFYFHSDVATVKYCYQALLCKPEVADVIDLPAARLQTQLINIRFF